MFDRLAPLQHDTLDGVPEPAETPSLFGHADIVARLEAAIRSGKVPQGMVFVGPRGVGKATLAFQFANALIGPPGTGLGASDVNAPTFRQIAMGAHPTVLHLTRPENDRTKGFKTVLTVEEVRRVQRFVGMTAGDGGWRVVIVDSADDMNRNASNALLKNLEEPPARTVFIVIAHSAGALLPTIRSRCQVLRFQPLAQDDLIAALRPLGDMGPVLESIGAALVARAGGSVRQAIILTTHGGLEIASALDGLAHADTVDPRDAHKLAEAVSGRDKAMQLDIFNSRASELLASAAQKAALANDVKLAAALSTAWQEARLAISETNTYNLDQKQHALSMIGRLNAALRGSAST